MSQIRSRSSIGGALFVLLLGSGFPVAGAAEDHEGDDHPPRIELEWTDCGTTEEGVAAGVQCAVADLPLDYDKQQGEQVHIAVSRVPATDPEHRIGSLFINLGGPGTPVVGLLQAVGSFVPSLNERFDIVGFDPRGVGLSTPAVDCQVNQETEGTTVRPWPVPIDLDAAAVVAHAQQYVDRCLATNGEILEHLSTANVARDLDALRAAVGDDKLTYLGYSYGAFLGSTYASLFPSRFRALALDAPLPAQQYIDDPVSISSAAAAGLERALSRFLVACAADQTACSGFGGSDPYTAYDALVASAGESPIPADGYPTDPRPVTAEDIRDVTLRMLFVKETWGLLAAALAQAAAGDGSTIRFLIDEVVYPRTEDGSFDPALDRAFAIFAADQHWPADVDAYLERGANEWAVFPHFWGRFA
jgi:pimeloyl-ACP methyl ester carboxylesterase